MPSVSPPVSQTERATLRDAPQEEIDERFYGIVTDLIGTPTELVDPDGNVAWRQRTSLWGAPLPGAAGETGAGGQTDCPLRFPGQYHDDESRLSYNFFRYYDPATAAYLSSDPIGLDGGFNPHAYVANPTIWTDPLGLTACGELPPGHTPSPALRGDPYHPDVVAKNREGWRKHYRDELARAAQKKVRDRQGPPGVHRIDAPEQHISRSQWHAQRRGTGEPGLNQDGTFRHGNPNFTRETLDWLHQHGWDLPDGRTWNP